MASTMFDAAEGRARVSREEFEAAEPDLRVDLINAQYDLRDAGFSVVILITGSDRHGAEALLDRLNQWMDARHIDSHGFDRVRDEELERPRFWRYWRALPRHGRSAILRGAWASGAIADRVLGHIGKGEYKRRVALIRQFEEMLVADGTLLLKFFVHLSRKELGKRIARGEKKPHSYPKIDTEDLLIYENYDGALELAGKFMKKTSVPGAEWTVVDGADARHRDLTVARTVLGALRGRLDAGGTRSAPELTTPLAAADGEYTLESLDLSASISRDDYKEQLDAQQGRLRGLGQQCWEAGRSSVFVFEGADAAGKGGAIRRITAALPALFVRVVPIAAPTGEERQQHYLWRFWRQLPRAGRMLIFDRSWYGRVLVERVEGFATRAQWQRAYEEIKSFEEQLVDHGMAVCKFWLHIDPEEQLRRFQAREETPYKKYKITDEDYRNRARGPAYVDAVDEMVARTNTDAAPWHLVAANDKRWARIHVLRHVCSALESALAR